MTCHHGNRATAKCGEEALATFGGATKVKLCLKFRQASSDPAEAGVVTQAVVGECLSNTVHLVVVARLREGQ